MLTVIGGGIRLDEVTGIRRGCESMLTPSSRTVKNITRSWQLAVRNLAVRVVPYGPNPLFERCGAHQPTLALFNHTS